MPNAAAMLQRKMSRGPKTIVSLPPSASVADAARLMLDQGVHCVLVMDADRLTGIASERDVLHHAVTPCRDPAQVPLAEIMSTPVACAAPETTLNEIRHLMRTRRIHHVR